MENIVYNPSVDCYSLHQEMINHSLQGEILNVKIENDKLKNENNELKHKLKQAIKLLMLSKKECIYNGDEFQTEYRIKCNDFIAEIKYYLDEMKNEGK